MICLQTLIKMHYILESVCLKVRFKLLTNLGVAGSIPLFSCLLDETRL